MPVTLANYDPTAAQGRGAPSIRSPELAECICAHIAEGKSLASFCRIPGNPSYQFVLNWLKQDKDFVGMYAQAREDQADVLAEEILLIADDGSNDFTTDQEGNSVVDHDHIARSKLRVDARKWLAAKLKPRKYGEKIGLEHSGEVSRVLLTESRRQELMDRRKKALENQY